MFGYSYLRAWGAPFGLLMAIAAVFTVPTRQALANEPLKVGLLMTVTSGPLMIAKEKGYFAAEGLDVDLISFDAGQPVAVAAVSGAIDFGAAGLTSALYTLAGQGALKIIAGTTYDKPPFYAAGLLVSNHAYDEGLKSIKDLPGHSMGLTQVGSTYHYAFAIVAEKYKVDLSHVRILPLQSFSNLASAIVGAQADAAIITKTVSMPLLENKQAKLLAWIADEVPWQVSAIWTATKNLTERPTMIDKFLSAVRKGTRDYDEAFIARDGTRKDGPTAPQILAIMQKYVHQTPEQMALSIGYTDPDLRLDLNDIQRQLTWYRSQGMLKTDIALNQVIDRRLVVPMK
jgi:NitT/TauT family transport system substrate-binding protein